jgi:hypothetical protein
MYPSAGSMPGVCWWSRVSTGPPSERAPLRRLPHYRCNSNCESQAACISGQIRTGAAMPNGWPTDPFAKTYAERAAREAGERAEKRRLELVEQRSADNPPSIRIRVWEKVHALCLPRDPEHPILYVIATGTGLTLAQVREEQRTRFPEQAAPVPPTRSVDVSAELPE